MQVEIVQDGRRLLPIIGPGHLSRAEAHAAIQSLLDRLGYSVADAWRAGARDDTAFVGQYLWTIYEHPDGDDTAAAMEWCSDLAAALKRPGARITVAKPTRV
jgi:hypothetical protein